MSSSHDTKKRVKTNNSDFSIDDINEFQKGSRLNYQNKKQKKKGSDKMRRNEYRYQ